jgi:hypothetical protein
MRVVFDTNALSNDSLTVLEASPMRQLCRRGKLTAVYGHVFLEETMRTYGSEKHRHALVTRRLPFIIDTVGVICDDFVNIWHSELVQGRGLKACVYMRKRCKQRFLDNCRNVPADGSWRAWHDTAASRAEEDLKRAEQKKISQDIREEILCWKVNSKFDPKKCGVPELWPFIQQNLLHAGRMFINTLVPCKDPQAVCDRWVQKPNDHPFFTIFVQNMLYIAFHAMVKPEAIDLNAQADLDVMTHLFHSNVLVTNELRFLRSAFEDLWHPRGKVIFTAKEFASFIGKL